MSARWWQPPSLHDEEDRHIERRVSWLELFYDLVFVVIVAEAAHYLATHPGLHGLLGYTLVFVALWWNWISGTFYNERFETSDLSYRAFVYAQMLPVAAMAIFAHDVLGETAVPFALSYVAARLLVVGLWLRAGWHTPAFRPVSNRYITGFLISIMLFLVSTLVPPPFRFWLWAAGLLVDLITPIFTIRQQAVLPRLSRSKLPERFGLFIIIVLGETMVGVISALAGQEHVALAALFDLALGLAVVFGMWWVYFDYVARRHPRAGFRWSFTWNYLHLPLAMSIAALGAGLRALLAPEHGEAAPGYWLIGGAFAIAFGTIALLETTLHRDPGEPTQLLPSVGLKLGATMLALLLTIGGQWLGTRGFLARCCRCYWYRCCMARMSGFALAHPPPRSPKHREGKNHRAAEPLTCSFQCAVAVQFCS